MKERESERERKEIQMEGQGEAIKLLSNNLRPLSLWYYIMQKHKTVALSIGLLDPK